MTKCVLCHWSDTYAKQRGIILKDGQLQKPGYMPRLNLQELAEIPDGEHSVCTDRGACRRRCEGHRLFAGLARL